MNAHLSDEAGEYCRQALAAVKHALENREKNPLPEVSKAVRCLVPLRNQLIEEKRAGTDSTLPQAFLDRVNGILSVAAGIEYPLGGLHRGRLEKVRDSLVQLLDSTTVQA